MILDVFLLELKLKAGLNNLVWICSYINGRTLNAKPACKCLTVKSCRVLFTTIVGDLCTKTKSVRKL